MTATRKPSSPLPSRSMATSTFLIRGTRLASAYPHTRSTAATAVTAAVTIRERAGSSTPAVSRPSRNSWASTDHTNSTQAAPSNASPRAASTTAPRTAAAGRPARRPFAASAAVVAAGPWLRLPLPGFLSSDLDLSTAWFHRRRYRWRGLTSRVVTGAGAPEALSLASSARGPLALGHPDDLQPPFGVARLQSTKGSAMPNELQNRTIAILAADGVEKVELEEPR